MAGALAVAGCQNSDQQPGNGTTGGVTSVDKNDSTSITWIDSTEQSLGKIKKGQVAEITWRFKNTGDKPLVVSNVTVGCGCTVAEKPEQPIPPGGEGLIKASFDSKSQMPNSYNKTVSVFSNVKSAHEKILAFSVEVTE